MTAGRTFSPATGGITATGVLEMASLRSGDVVAGRFRIERLLGMGGMGVVYQARDLELDVDVALKLLRPELASRPDAFERFRQELLLARQVSSPHVVRIHDLVRHGDVWLISMDFVPGESLEKRLDARGKLAPDDAIRITRELALGLAAAHRRGVIHRDLKPANVLIGEDGEARITDFGVARSAGSTGITVSGVIIGTPEYLSPEQARADPVDARSDLYALGLILHEMLTGTLPFRGGTPAEMLAQRIVRDPPPADTIDRELPAFAVRLCARLVELRPARRFQSADDVVRAIDTRRLPGAPIRRRTWLSLAAGLLVVAAIAGYVAWRRTAPPATTSGTSAPLARGAALAILPIVTGTEDSERDLAAGIRHVLADRLIGAGADADDAAQVDRALTELRFDAAAARRQRARVFETLGAKRLLDVELARDAHGYTLRAALRGSDEAKPAEWTFSRQAIAASELPSALAALDARLRGALGIGAAQAAPWPDADTLATIGRLASERDTAKIDANALATEARRAGDPALWWSAMAVLDRADRVADATSLARAASDALAGCDDAASKRTRAYASVLIGDADAAAKALTPLAAATPRDLAVARLLARVDTDRGEFDAAAATLDRVVAADPRDVEAWFALGKNAILAGDSKRAVDDYLTRAQILANRLDDARMQADVAHALGIGYQNLGQIDDAARQFEQAIRLRGARGDDRGVAVSLRNLSTVYAVQGRFDEAQASLDRARKLLEPLGDNAAMADLSNDEGVLKEERGDYRGALASYRAALALYQAGGHPRRIGNSLLNVGFAYYEVGEFDNAEVYWNQAAANYAKIDDFSGIVRARQSLGLAETARGDFVAARKALDASLAQAEQLQMAEERSISLASLADLDRLEGENTRALERAAQALDQFRQREDARGAVEMALLRSAVLRNAGDWDAAAGALDGVAPDTVENSEQKALVSIALGEIALGRDTAAAALAHADAAIAVAREAHSYASELSARLLRTRALARLGRDRDASAELAKARSALAGYASAPLRLALAETALLVGARGAIGDYRAARGELAKMPSYARALELHALAARALGSGADASAARSAARSALARMTAATPAPQQATLARLAATYGIASASDE